MSRHVLGLTALVAAIMVGIVCVATTAQVTTNQAGTEIYSIDLSGSAPSGADEVSAQRRAAR